MAPTRARIGIEARGGLTNPEGTEVRRSPGPPQRIENVAGGHLAALRDAAEPNGRSGCLVPPDLITTQLQTGARH